MLIELDAIDRKIIAALTANAKAGNAELGKAAGCSKEVAGYRLKRLMDSGIIKSFITVFWLGHTPYKVLLRLAGAGAKKEQEIISYLTSHRSINWVTSCVGSCDIMFTIMAKDHVEFDNILREALNETGISARSYLFAMGIDAEAYGPRYAVKMPVQNKPEKNAEWHPEFDTKDRMIADMLRNNARMPFVEIWKRTKMPVDTIRYRIKKMEQNNVIRRYRAILDSSKLGFHRYEIFIACSMLDENTIKKAKGYIRQKNCVEYLERHVGMWDFEITAHFKTSEELREFILGLKELFGERLREINSAELFETYNYTYML